MQQTILTQRVAGHLKLIYPELEVADLVAESLAVMGLSADTPSPEPHRNLWDQSDVMMITYGDSLKRAGEAPLHTLAEFLDKRVKEAISTVHILPFFPYTSDDGGSVMDYTSVNPALGE